SKRDWSSTCALPIYLQGASAVRTPQANMRMLGADARGDRFYFLLRGGVCRINQLIYALATIVITHHTIKSDHRSHGVGEDTSACLCSDALNGLCHPQCADNLAGLLMHIGRVKSRIVISGHCFLSSL